ncbi:MAG: caspase family protein [Magnetococcus sp. YQC-9]
MVSWLALIGLPAEAWSRGYHVLLIGVSHYPQLAPDDRLQGPLRDVPLMREVVRKMGVSEESITVLADGVDGAQGAPTRQAILSSMDRLAQTAQRDDLVYVYFAGHGSQEPVVDPSRLPEEPDGLDETILPIDAREWNRKTGHVENAILDNEIRDALVNIRNRGAFVWLVFDSCHSGTMTRALPVDGKVRRVDPQNLGVPTTLPSQTSSRERFSENSTVIPEGPGVNPDAGGYVAFFAAQSDQLAKEKNLPYNLAYGHPEKLPHGVFTFTLAQVLSSHSGMTYRQAAEQILQHYALNREVTTPLFEGTGLDTPILGFSGGERHLQWPVIKDEDHLTLSAGTLQQLGPGTRLALLRSSTAPLTEALGYVEVEQAHLTVSRLRPIAWESQPLPVKEQLPSHLFGRVVERRFSLELRVALPPVSEEPSAGAGVLQKVLDKLRAENPPELRLHWVASNEEADVRLVIRQGQLWFLPPGGEIVEQGSGKMPSILGQGDMAELQEKVTDSLLRIGKVTNLLRLGGEVLTKHGSGERLQIGVEVRRVDRRTVDLSRNQPLQCDQLPRLAAESVDLTRVPVLDECDQIALEVKNPSNKAMDLTMLFVSADFGIDSLFPVDGAANRIEAGRSLSFPPFYVRFRDEQSGESLATGRERILFIAVEMEEYAPMSEFTFLAQKALPKTRKAGVAARNDLMGLLEEVGFAVTRGDGVPQRGEQRTPALILDKTEMRILNLETRKRP